MPHHECRWAGTDEKLDDYFRRLKAAVPAPPAAGWLAYAAAPVLIIGGAAIGYWLNGGYGTWVGLLVGLGLGLLLVIARLIGLR